jgi:hypothetical protein
MKFVLILGVLILLPAAKVQLKLNQWSYLWALKKSEICNVMNISITNRGDFRKFINTWANCDFELKRGKETKQVSYTDIQESLNQVPLAIPFP